MRGFFISEGFYASSRQYTERRSKKRTRERAQKTAMNAIFLVSCLLVYLACDTRRRGVVATMALGLAFVFFLPASGHAAYWQHIAIELSILISLQLTRSPWYYKLLFLVALLTHLSIYSMYGITPVPAIIHHIYELILSVIYTLFLIVLTKAECGLFSWWPPARKKKNKWQAKGMVDGAYKR